MKLAVPSAYTEGGHPPGFVCPLDSKPTIMENLSVWFYRIEDTVVHLFVLYHLVRTLFFKRER